MKEEEERKAREQEERRKLEEQLKQNGDLMDTSESVCIL